MHNKFTVKDSFSFVHDVISLPQVSYMCSYDVVSLYTNIPIELAIEICLSKLYSEKETVKGLTKENMKKLLNYCLKQNHFAFDDRFYDQIDGVAMGSPLGPTIANIFMSNFEEKVFDSYEGNLPIFYRRYIDDVFAVFNDYDDCQLFLEYMNNQNDNIKFTLETENEDCLPFLDVMITRECDGSVSTSVYRKPNFSGLVMQYDSFVPAYYKKSLVNGLIHRAWKICSSIDLFHQELTKIKQLLLPNGFPLKFVNRQIHQFLQKKKNYNEPRDIICGPDKKMLYMSLPYAGQNSVRLNRQIGRIFNKVAPWSKVNIIFKPVQRLNCISKLKSTIPLLNRSNVIYKINCIDCNSFYVGLTTRRLQKRLYEHKNRKYSSVFKHSSAEGHDIDYNCPEVLTSDNVKLRLQIKETLLIQQLAAHKSLNVNIDSFECRLW